MARYVVSTRRGERGRTASALEAVQSDPDVTVVSGDNPDTVTIEASQNAADRLRAKLSETHFVEPEMRRSLH
jgi:hypothetical protein